MINQKNETNNKTKKVKDKISLNENDKIKKDSLYFKLKEKNIDTRQTLNSYRHNNSYSLNSINKEHNSAINNNMKIIKKMYVKKDII